MTVVLDTNALVSGLLTPHGPAGRIITLIADGALCAGYDPCILREYASVLRRPRFGFREGNVRALLGQIEAEGRLAVAVPLDVSLPDPKDRPFLEVAVALRADALITGNRRHFPASMPGLAILSPGEFIERLASARAM
jgi:putative PIN family toxin of toxin-antitoxin system